MAVRKIDGPYQVKQVGSEYEVLYLDSASNNYVKLIPHRKYSERCNAHRRAAKLNKQWQKEQNLCQEKQ